MQPLKYTLSSGIEIQLSEDDVKGLKTLIDQEVLKLEFDFYENLKRSTPAIIENELSKMSDSDLIPFARVHDAKTELNLMRLDSFSKKIYRELFKRAGLGHKQVRSLSRKQLQYMDSIGLKTKNRT